MTVQLWVKPGWTESGLQGGGTPLFLIQYDKNATRGSRLVLISWQAGDGTDLMDHAELKTEGGGGNKIFFSDPVRMDWTENSDQFPILIGVGSVDLRPISVMGADFHYVWKLGEIRPIFTLVKNFTKRACGWVALRTYFAWFFRIINLP